MDNNVNPFGQPGQQPNAVPDAQPAPQPTTQPAAQSAPQPTNDPMFPNAAPATPAMPSAPQPMNAYGPITPVAQGNKKSHKGLIIGSIAGVVAILTVVLVVVLIGLNGVKPEDYRKAYSKLTNVDDVAYDIQSEMGVSSIDSEEDFNEAKESVNEVIDKGQGLIDEVGNMKAITADKDAKAKFETLKQSYGEMVTTAKSSFDKMGAVIPVYLAMSDMDYTSDYGTMASSFQSVADKAKAVKVDDDKLKGAMNDVAEAAEAYANYYRKLAAGDYSVSYSSIRDASNKLSDSTDVVVKAFGSDELSDSAKKATDAYYDLRDYLLDKSTSK